jgi:hypothetical protein
MRRGLENVLNRSLSRAYDDESLRRKKIGYLSTPRCLLPLYCRDRDSPRLKETVAICNLRRRGRRRRGGERGRGSWGSGPSITACKGIVGCLFGSR